ncbi:protein O-linked-mannose beta-1,2-N-acetylglucosaminyltransferase 1-like [Scylla paramamosain]|uniref:protein O-linked-mannose beta-1,2-N-acetylglucosaminyltransferase 1-like n=1 Tax=Scylla paramamosain TaxID=85552 RepID=UPI00308296CA
MRRVRRLLRGRPLPATHLRLSFDVRWDSAAAFLQGVPVRLYGAEQERWLGELVSVAVVHQATGRLLRQYNHPTQAHARPLQAFLDSLQPGRVLLLAGSTFQDPDTSVTSLLAELGIDWLLGRGGGAVLWAWVGVVGSVRAAGEASVIWRPWNRNRQILTWEIHLPKAPEVPWCGGGGGSISPLDSKEEEEEEEEEEEGGGVGAGRWAARAELCTAHDGYGAWCNCPPPPPPPSPPRVLQNNTVASTWRIENVVTVVLARHPPALHRLLISLENAGAEPKDILVFTGQQQKAPKELQLVCKSHGVHLEITGRSSDCMGLHVARLYESALMASLILRPKASFFITLEDDMVVLPFFYRWMVRGRKILKKTQEFICVNSLNPKYPYKLYQYPRRTLGDLHLSSRTTTTTITTTATTAYSFRSPLRDNGRSPGDTTPPEGKKGNGRGNNNMNKFPPEPNKKTASGDTLRGPGTDTRAPREVGVVTGAGLEDGGRQWPGGKFMAGWGMERSLVEAMIRFWPLAKRDVDWETLVETWAGIRPCLLPSRPHALHARAAHLSLGPDLPPLL